MYFLDQNKKKFLSNLSPLFILLFVFVLILFRSTIVGVWSNLFNEWDILLPFAIYFGQRRQVMEGVALTILVAHLYSLSSTAPIGIFTLSYLLIFLSARVLSSVIYANHIHSILSVLLGFAVFSQLIRLLIAHFFGHSWSLMSWSFVNAIWMNTLLGFVVYLGISGLDKVTEKRSIRQIKVG